MRKLLLFLALAVVALASACVDKTNTGATIDDSQDVAVEVVPDEDMQSSLDDEMTIEEVTDEEETPRRRTTTARQVEDDDEEDDGPRFIQLKEVTIDKDEVFWGDTLTVTYTIWNNKSKAHRYNVIIQIFDEDENRVFNLQEEGLNIVGNKTKTFTSEVDITNTFKRGDTYDVHVGLFDEDWNMLEWNWMVGNFTVA